MVHEHTMVEVKLLVSREVCCDYNGTISYGGLAFFLSTEHYEKLSVALKWNEVGKLGSVWYERPTEWTSCIVRKNDYERLLNDQFLAPELVYFSALDVDQLYMLGRAGEDEVYTA